MLERWLRGSFAKKEKLLKSFYENGSCALSVDPFASTSSPSSSSTSSSPQKKQNDELWPPLLATTLDTSRPMYLMALSVAVNAALFVTYPWARWIVTIMVLACVAGRLVGGLDRLELAVHGDMLIAESRRAVTSKEE